MSLTKNIAIALSIVAISALVYGAAAHCAGQTGRILELQRQVNLLKLQFRRAAGLNGWSEEGSDDESEEGSDSEDDDMHASISAVDETAESDGGSIESTGEEMVIEQD